MVDSVTKSAGVGSETRQVTMTVDEILFVSAGLRDMADLAAKRSLQEQHDEDRETENDIVIENTRLAEFLLSQI